MQRKYARWYKGQVDASLPAVHMYEHLGYKTIRHENMALQNGTVLVYDIMRKDL